MLMIQLINLTKRYKSLCAVDGINLEIEEGARFGFLGPNGAGKDHDHQDDGGGPDAHDRPDHHQWP